MRCRSSSPKRLRTRSVRSALPIDSAAGGTARAPQPGPLGAPDRVGATASTVDSTPETFTSSPRDAPHGTLRLRAQPERAVRPVDDRRQRRDVPGAMPRHVDAGIRGGAGVVESEREWVESGATIARARRRKRPEVAALNSEPLPAGGRRIRRRQSCGAVRRSRP
jgi:hypothetical protein